MLGVGKREGDIVVCTLSSGTVADVECVLSVEAVSDVHGRMKVRFLDLIISVACSVFCVLGVVFWKCEDVAFRADACEKARATC